MDAIPDELLVKIIDKIGSYDLLPFRGVSKRWMRIVDEIKIKRANVFNTAIKSCNFTWKGFVSTGQEPHAREFFASARNGRFIYVFGGKNGHNGLYSFDLSTYKWSFIEAGGQLPAPRDSCAFAAYKDKLFVFGGRCYQKYLNDTYIFDTTSKQWSGVSYGEGNHPTACGNTSASAVGDVVVMFGGFICTIGRYLDDLWLFHTQTLRWEICDARGSKPPPSAYHSQFTISKSRIIVFQGVQMGSDIWLLDVDEKWWTKVRVDEMSVEPVVRLTPPVMTNGHIVVLSRKPHEEDQLVQHLHVLDCAKIESASSCEWITCGPLDHPLPARLFFTALAGKDEILLFGGRDMTIGESIRTIILSGRPSVSSPLRVI